MQEARCNNARTTTLAYCDDNADGDHNGNDRAADDGGDDDD